MSMTKTSTQVPKLRFPGYEGAWFLNCLGTKSDVRDGTHDSPKYVVNGYPLVTSKNLSADGQLDLSDVDLVSVEDFNAINRRSKVDVGDILFGMIGTIGNPVQVRECEFAIKNVALIKQREELLNSFVVQYLRAPPIARQFHIENVGGTQKFIGLGTIRSLAVSHPTVPEQQKIAAFLTAVDGRIEQLSRKKALLEATKKGVMQQLFTQTLRFQDDHGHDFPDWEEKTLGELTTWTSGGTPSKDEPSYWDGDIPWLSAASMHERYYDDSPLKISEEGLRNGSRIAKKGSLLLLVRGSMLWNRIPVGIATRDLAFNQDVKALALTKEVQAEFLLQWFIASENMLLHTVVGTGIGAGKLDTEEMKRLQVLLPSLPEQTKIAGFLSAMDGKIAAVGEQMRQSQAWKKGLLQQMFV